MDARGDPELLFRCNRLKITTILQNKYINNKCYNNASTKYKNAKHTLFIIHVRSKFPLNLCPKQENIVPKICSENMVKLYTVLLPRKCGQICSENINVLQHSYMVVTIKLSTIWPYCKFFIRNDVWMLVIFRCFGAHFWMGVYEMLHQFYMVL